jgi:hypothetical protein
VGVLAGDPGVRVGSRHLPRQQGAAGGLPLEGGTNGDLREDQASAMAASVEEDGSPPYRSFIEEHRPQLRFYESCAADYETSTLNLLERLDLSCPDDFEFEPRMKRQSDRVNDDWSRRYSELRLGRDFDLFPIPVEEKAREGA